MTVCTLPEQRDSRGNFVTTYSGAKFFIDEVNIQDIPMYDIAHALSMNCRFNGHISKFYSVAEHSVNVSLLVPNYGLEALLHDVSEAFLPDMPRPFKGMITGFDEYEYKIHTAFAEHYGLQFPLPAEVKYIDTNIVSDEAAVLYPEPPEWINFYDSVCPHSMIIGYSPEEACSYFMERFTELMYERANGTA